MKNRPIFTDWAAVIANFMYQMKIELQMYFVLLIFLLILWNFS